MDHLHKIDVKLFVKEGREIPAFDFMPVFQRWIQQHTIPGVLIDVADYSHMHDGPGIILVGHDFNVSMDYEGGEMGLLYRRKQPVHGMFQERLLYCIQALLKSGAILEQEPEFKGRLTFDATRLLLISNDRLHGPNDEKTAAQFGEQIEEVAGRLYTGHVDVKPFGGDPRNRLAIEARAREAHDLGEVLAATSPQQAG